MRSAPVLVLSLLLTACAPDAPVNPGGGDPAPGTVGGACLQDGSCNEGLRCEDDRCVVLVEEDAGTTDAGDVGAPDAGDDDDAGLPEDGGVVDGGLVDAGGIDGGTDDAGFTDAGSTDAGLEDAGDGGTDAGAPDAGPPAPCQRNADCVGGQRCTLVESQGTLIATCTAPVGAGAPGAACTVDTDCAAGLCLDGACSALCVSPADCGSGQVCVEETVTTGGASGAFDLCVTLPEQSCTDSDVCATDGRVCGEIDFDSDPLTAYCALPIEDGLPFGDFCMGSTSLNAQCEERLCLHDRCTRLCADDTDCTGAPSGFGCTDINFTGGGVLRMCVDTCAKDPDCADPDHACVITVDNTDDALEWLCREPTRPDPPGTACPTQNTCDHGVCIRSRDNDGNVTDSYCSLPCEVDADCPTELPVCEDANFSRPSGSGVQVLRVCGRP